jgi:hypothetical protein
VYCPRSRPRTDYSPWRWPSRVEICKETFTNKDYIYFSVLVGVYYFIWYSARTWNTLNHKIIINCKMPVSKLILCIYSNILTDNVVFLIHACTSLAEFIINILFFKWASWKWPIGAETCRWSVNMWQVFIVLLHLFGLNSLLYRPIYFLSFLGNEFLVNDLFCF